MFASFGSGNPGNSAVNTIAGEVGGSADKRTKNLINSIADHLNGQGGVIRSKGADRKDLQSLLTDIQSASRTDIRPTLSNADYKSLLAEAESLI